MRKSIPPKKWVREKILTDVLNQAIEDADEAQAQAEEQNVGLLTGENEDIHTAVIEAQKAELALSLAVQVRNKVVDAYNEVMRMQL